MFFPSIRALLKLDANGTYTEQKSAYSTLQLYPSVTICMEPGDLKAAGFMHYLSLITSLFSDHFVPQPQVQYIISSTICVTNAFILIEHRIFLTLLLWLFLFKTKLKI